MKVKSVAIKVAAISAVLAPTFAMADSAALDTAFTAVSTEVLAAIAGAAAIGVVIMNASLVWDVGMNLYKKFVKKGAR